jgi:hypothetical protein
VGGLLVALAIVAGTGSRTEMLRHLVVRTLSERLDAEVELQAFGVDTFPTVHITGGGLVLRHKGRRDVPPLVSIDSFTVDGGLIGLFSRPRRFRTVTLTGLQVTIPAGGLNGKGEANGTADANEPPSVGTNPPSGRADIVVGTLMSENARLVLLPKRAGKKPREFAIHRLTMESLGHGNAMPFDAALTNPVPTGLIQTSGSFGPWGREDPGSTPLSGRFTFDDVDLSTIKGIGGTLSANGTFGGRLDRITVNGETRTPDFRVNVSGNPVPLHTRFDATVDGTDGDTYLNSVSGKFLETSLQTKGAVVGASGVQGRTVRVHVTIDNGRMEDLLRLAVKGSEPVMTGTLALRADMSLPAGPEDVIERLELSGQFSVAAGRFGGRGVQEQISNMSERARGRDSKAQTQDVASDVRAQFRLDRGVLTIQKATFGIPGAAVQMAGTYGLASGALAFDGTLRMQASVSEAAGGGLKGFFLKAVDPLFRREGAGAMVPIRIRGTREQPKFGLDVGRTLRRQ